MEYHQTHLRMKCILFLSALESLLNQPSLQKTKINKIQFLTKQKSKRINTTLHCYFIIAVVFYTLYTAVTGETGKMFSDIAGEKERMKEKIKYLHYITLHINKLKE